jgi:hypothetical protein
MRGEALREACHLPLQPAPGTADVGSCQVDPGLDLGHLCEPSPCLVGTGRAPGLGDPGRLEQQAGPFDAPLGSSAQLVAFGQVRGITLEGRPGLIEVIGCGAQRRQRGGGSRRGPPDGQNGLGAGHF